MGNPLIGENLFLLYSIAMGIFITFVYDLFRILRRVISHNSFFVSLEDLVFWIFCAISVFLMMQRQSNGNLRWFAVLGAMTGMLAYKKTVSGILVKGVSRLLVFLGKPLAFLGKKRKQFLRFLKKRLTALKKMLRMILCKQ